MSAFLHFDYYSFTTVIGLGWTLATFWLMFTARGRALLANPWSILVAAAALGPSVWYASAEVAKVSALAGGLKPLDAYANGYDLAKFHEFAQALGEAGRAKYAAFQLSADTLAPPAFACFIMSVYRSTVRSSLVQRVLTAMVFSYFVSVLITNTFMPVMMHNYPEADAGVLPLLYRVVPPLDLLKFKIHGALWLVILGAWVWQLASRWLPGRNKIST